MPHNRSRSHSLTSRTSNPDAAALGNLPVPTRPLPLNDPPGKIYPGAGGSPRDIHLNILGRGHWVSLGEAEARETARRQAARREVPWAEINGGVFDDSADF
jgi:hypothetical protein